MDLHLQDPNRLSVTEVVLSPEVLNDPVNLVGELLNRRVQPFTLRSLGLLRPAAPRLARRVALARIARPRAGETPSRRLMLLAAALKPGWPEFMLELFCRLGLAGNVKIAVIGTGYVASAYLRAIHFLGYSPLVLSRRWSDYTDPDVLERALRANLSGPPAFIINASGYTGATIDDCETNRAECYAANVGAVRVISAAARKIEAGLIHVSSGCMFDGPGPFKEEDSPNNLKPWYNQCKMWAEQEVLLSAAKAWIFRIRMPFCQRTHPRNWLWKLAGYPRILDGLNSVTFLDEFAMRSFQLAGKGVKTQGIYHAASSIPLTTLEVTKVLFAAGIRKAQVQTYLPEDFLRDHVKRSAAVLDSTKFEKAYGAAFGDPMVAIRWCIENFGVERAKPTVSDASDMKLH